MSGNKDIKIKLEGRNGIKSKEEIKKFKKASLCAEKKKELGNEFFRENIRKELKDNEQKFLVKDDYESSNIIAVGNIRQKREKRQKGIEKILEADLGDRYLNMPPEKQREFRNAGEKTAKEINSLLDKAKIKIGKIISLIKKWLFIIPGVNKFFLEQEAKIKADKIIKIKDNF